MLPKYEVNEDLTKKDTGGDTECPEVWKLKTYTHKKLKETNKIDRE